MALRADYTELPDSQLVLLLKESNAIAFTEMVNRYHTLLFSFAYRRLDDKEQARDLVHDTFANIWEKRAMLIIEGILEAYLVQVVKNKILDHFKHQQVSRKYIENFGKYLNNTQNNTDHLVRHNDLSTLIEKEIAALPEKLRVVFELSRKKSMNRKEISEYLGIPENTVKTNLQRSLKILRVKLPTTNLSVLFPFL
ncbi:RNA polymerase sigma factor [Pedobacter gandavensis]|uniref:RNA polymerase sigma-70 factor n=1 Tax=Pedobacter gandavensis TaxID=2679963 RepID=A0ABR6ET99_9SPHI|nr:RNA polymerase sigma-70 factor [Pedobacter gandavensis]MBB2148489.1 RNA polymerase sigma-70 factor [Pedobacter gandavensis]